MWAPSTLPAKPVPLPPILQSSSNISLSLAGPGPPVPSTPLTSSMP